MREPSRPSRSRRVAVGAAALMFVLAMALLVAPSPGSGAALLAGPESEATLGPQTPSVAAIPDCDFVATEQYLLNFQIDSRPEIGTWDELGIYPFTFDVRGVVDAGIEPLGDGGLAFSVEARRDGASLEVELLRTDNGVFSLTFTTGLGPSTPLEAPPVPLRSGVEIEFFARNGNSIATARLAANFFATGIAPFVEVAGDIDNSVPVFSGRSQLTMAVDRSLDELIFRAGDGAATLEVSRASTAGILTGDPRFQASFFVENMNRDQVVWLDDVFIVGDFNGRVEDKSLQLFEVPISDMRDVIAALEASPPDTRRAKRTLRKDVKKLKKAKRRVRRNATIGRYQSTTRGERAAASLETAQSFSQSALNHLQTSSLAQEILIAIGDVEMAQHEQRGAALYLRGFSERLDELSIDEVLQLGCPPAGERR